MQAKKREKEIMYLRKCLKHNYQEERGYIPAFFFFCIFTLNLTPFWDWLPVSHPWCRARQLIKNIKINNQCSADLLCLNVCILSWEVNTSVLYSGLKSLSSPPQAWNDLFFLTNWYIQYYMFYIVLFSCIQFFLKLLFLKSQWCQWVLKISKCVENS